MCKSNKKVVSKEIPWESLAPRELTKNDASYKSVEALRNAMADERNLNVAVAGGFGSGKTSVINTYIKESGIKTEKILRVSLSNFKDIEKKITSKNDTKYENAIEEQLFKQILYKSNALKTRQSRQHRTVNIPHKYAILIGIGIIAYIVAILLLCNQIHTILPNSWLFLYKSSACESFQIWFRRVIDGLAIIYLLGASVSLLELLIRKGNKFNIKSLTAKDVKIDLERDGTYLFRNLDEILYFFRAGEYELVLWEDIDRLQYSEKLFLKLREINLLLNESATICKKYKPIRFIYAIRDDVFTGEVRTKFFDYIVPIIPIVDTYNAGDYLIEKYGKELHGIENHDIATLGMYIRGKRELTSIMNDYLTYNQSIIAERKLQSKKLLALLIYKSLFPTDYTNAYEKEGFLYTLFASKNKELFYYDLIKEDVEKIKHTKEQQRQAELKIESARRAIVEYLKSQHKVTKLIIGGREYPLDRFITNSTLFEMLSADKIDQYCYIDDDEINEVKYDFKYSEIKNEVDKEGNIDETMYKNNNILREENEKNLLLQKRIDRIKGQKIQTLMKDIGLNGVRSIMNQLCVISHKGNNLITETEKQEIEFLINLVNAGYIEEDYPLYMSYTYTGTLTENDYVFINALMRNETLDFNHHIDNCSAVYTRLSTENYKDKSILNIIYLNYLLSCENATSAMLDLFIITARENPEFVVNYSASDNVKPLFFEKLFTGWIEPISKIISIEDDNIRDNMMILFFRTAPHGIRLSENEKILLASRYSFIAQNIDSFDLKKLHLFLKEQKILFDPLNPKDAKSAPLFDYVTTNLLFKVNEGNLRAIYGELFETQSLTTISNGNTTMMEYIFNDLNLLLDHLPETDTNEDPKTTLMIVNKDSVDENKLKLYLRRQTKKIDPDEVEIDKRILMLYQINSIEPTWENVDKYFKTQDDAVTITSFIISNKDVLLASECEVNDNGYIEQFLLADNTTLPMDDYKLFVNCFTRKMDESEIPEELDVERLSILIENDLIPYSNAMLMRLSNKNLTVFTKYIIKYYDDYKDDDKCELEWTNEMEIAFLNSTATIDKKIDFLNQIAVISDDSYAKELARLVCLYYNKATDLNDADIKLINKSLSLYNESNDWNLKISLINKVHSYFKYDKANTTSYLNALGGEYLKLNELYAHASLDENPQNHELLEYLKNNGHFVSSYKLSFGQYKVTNKRK